MNDLELFGEFFTPRTYGDVVHVSGYHKGAHVYFGISGRAHSWYCIFKPLDKSNHAIEDTGATEDDLKHLFGDEIAFLVDGVTKQNAFLRAFERAYG